MIILRSINNYNHNTRLLPLFLSRLWWVNTQKAEAGAGAARETAHSLSSLLWTPRSRRDRWITVGLCSPWSFGRQETHVSRLWVYSSKLFDFGTPWTAGHRLPSPAFPSCSAPSKRHLGERPKKSLGDPWKETTTTKIWYSTGLNWKLKPKTLNEAFKWFINEFEVTDQNSHALRS